MKTLEFTSTMNPVILEEFQSPTHRLVQHSSQSFLHLFDSNDLHLDSISAICLLGYACSLHFPELSYIRNPTLKWPTFCLTPGSCQHSYSSNLYHMCSSASARAPAFSPSFFSARVNSILSRCSSKTAEPNGSLLLLESLLLSCLSASLFQAKQFTRYFPDTEIPSIEEANSVT